MIKQSKNLIAFLFIFAFFASAAVFFAVSLWANAAEGPRTITSNQTGVHDGYDYELWKDSGTTSMTLNEGGAFNCSWSNIGNALFRKGVKFDSTKTHSQIGAMSVKYACQYSPVGNSYLCVYGWSVSPLIEYYIVDSWGSWRPPGNGYKGSFTADGGTYEIYETTRVDQPSIQGNTTFQQYWSVRTEKRTSGTISITEHFNKWATLNMNLGKMYETALTVEGYQSSGNAKVTQNVIMLSEKLTLDGCSVTGEAKFGNTVKVTAAAPERGMMFDGFEVSEGNVTLAADSQDPLSASFVMPPREVVIKSTYKNIDYNITVSGGTFEGVPQYGQTIRLVGSEENREKGIEKWVVKVVLSGEEVAVSRGVFIMPDGDVTATAVTMPTDDELGDTGGGDGGEKNFYDKYFIIIICCASALAAAVIITLIIVFVKKKNA